MNDKGILQLLAVQHGVIMTKRPLIQLMKMHGLKKTTHTDNMGTLGRRSKAQGGCTAAGGCTMNACERQMKDKSRL